MGCLFNPKSCVIGLQEEARVYGGTPGTERTWHTWWHDAIPERLVEGKRLFFSLHQLVYPRSHKHSLLYKPIWKPNHLDATLNADCYLRLSSQAGTSSHSNHRNPCLGWDKLQHGGQRGPVWWRRSLLLKNQTLMAQQVERINYTKRHHISLVKIPSPLYRFLFIKAEVYLILSTMNVNKLTIGKWKGDVWGVHPHTVHTNYNSSFSSANLFSHCLWANIWTTERSSQRLSEVLMK